MKNIKGTTNILIVLSLLIIILVFLTPINAEEISDNNINQYNDDNIINNIDDEENIVDLSVNDKVEDTLEDGGKTSIYVSADGDDSSGDGSKNKPYKTIQQGIDNSADESTIYLSKGTFDASNLTVDKALTIQGEKDKTMLDGKKSSRLFLMNSNAKLTLIGLTLINGNMTADGEEGLGGSIYNDGGELTLIDCTIKDSYSSFNGGAIYNNLGKLTIKNSNIINNTAVQYGGAIYSAGITNIEKSYFTENHITAEKGVGGAIACGGLANIEDTIFFKNYAIYSAAAIVAILPSPTALGTCRGLPVQSPAAKTPGMLVRMLRSTGM